MDLIIKDNDFAQEYKIQSGGQSIIRLPSAL
jgi:hypothetical protein